MQRHPDLKDDNELKIAEFERYKELEAELEKKQDYEGAIFYKNKALEILREIDIFYQKKLEEKYGTSDLLEIYRYEYLENQTLKKEIDRLNKMITIERDIYDFFVSEIFGLIRGIYSEIYKINNDRVAYIERTLIEMNRKLDKLETTITIRDKGQKSIFKKITEKFLKLTKKGGK